MASYVNRTANVAARRAFRRRLRRVLGAFTPRFWLWPIVLGMRMLRILDVAATAILPWALAVVLFVPNAAAHEAPARLTEVAHVYSQGAGEVRCASRAEWDADFGSSFGWAYTNLRDDHAVLGPVACEGALRVGTADVPAWQQALGALVLTHEAFHLRRWRFRANEGKVECQALVYFKDAARRLGATAAQAENLYPYALALHAYEVRLFPQYRDPTCLIPPWAPPTEST